METINSILSFVLLHYKGHSLTVFELVSVLAIFLATKILLWLIKKTLNRENKFHKLDKGSLFALFQLIKYIIWIISIGFMLEMIGVKITLLLAGSAALLVGIGLGLQQTFNDILSGIILLFEHSVKVDDILEIDGDIVKIQEIGLRTSKGLNRNQIVVILPNSLITTNKVINWSHQTKKTLFKIDVGVAYDSNVDFVVELLEKSVLEHPEILKDDLLEGRLVNFGSSSLDFQVLFYSQNIFYIEKIKSDIRKIIIKNFNEHNITIPFTQVDLNMKSKN
ncbi:MAG: mechanosensitive ion channel [Flavobacteriaceae bacterium]